MNFISLQPEWVSHFEKSIEVANSKIDKYTPHNWRMYNEGKDSSYNDGYNQGLLDDHDKGWDEAKVYYHKIFEQELREAKQQRNAGSDEGIEVTYEGEENELDEWDK